ncbi:MAG TPA: hypothetical protein VGD13_12575 [Xanthobacteraceae bacterium]|jgi:hypothetical protein
MPRYYFNLKDGPESLDQEGTELADIGAARKEAVRYCGELLCDGPADSLWVGDPMKLWVTDAPAGKGKTLFTLMFSAVGEP